MAISVAANLFFAAVALTPPARESEDSEDLSNYELFFAVASSVAAVAFIPHSPSSNRLSLLLAMHALQFIPLLLPNRFTQKGTSIIPMSTFYASVAAVAMALRLRSTRIPSGLQIGDPSVPPSFRDILNYHWQTLNSHPVQSSIGWDVIWTTISFLVWEALRPGDKRWTVLLPCVLTVLWGVGFAAPAIWALYL